MNLYLKQETPTLLYTFILAIFLSPADSLVYSLNHGHVGSIRTSARDLNLVESCPEFF